MRKRILPAVGLIGGVTLGAWLAVWLVSLQPGISRANYERIREGMTQQEVEILLAGPAREPTSIGNNWAGDLHNGKRHPDHTRQVWADDDAGIILVLDADGRVVYKSWVPRHETLWGKFRAWIKP